MLFHNCGTCAGLFTDLIPALYFFAVAKSVGYREVQTAMKIVATDKACFRVQWSRQDISGTQPVATEKIHRAYPDIPVCPTPPCKYLIEIAVFINHSAIALNRQAPCLIGSLKIEVAEIIRSRSVTAERISSNIKLPRHTIERN